jgi:hypothetical protein
MWNEFSICGFTYNLQLSTFYINEDANGAPRFFKKKLNKWFQNYTKLGWIFISFKINSGATSCLNLKFKYAFLLELKFWQTFWNTIG